MSNELKTLYNGIEIEYRDDKWCFELRGKECQADTLSAAREEIGKPAPKEKNTFDRIKAYYWGYGSDKRETVSVTSIAMKSHYSSSTEVWISTSKGRSKVSAHRVFPVNAYNDALIVELKNMDAAKKALEKRIADTEDNLTPFMKCGE